MLPWLSRAVKRLTAALLLQRQPDRVPRPALRAPRSPSWPTPDTWRHRWTGPAIEALAQPSFPRRACPREDGGGNPGVGAPATKSTHSRHAASRKRAYARVSCPGRRQPLRRAANPRHPPLPRRGPLTPGPNSRRQLHRIAADPYAALSSMTRVRPTARRAFCSWPIWDLWSGLTSLRTAVSLSPRRLARSPLVIPCSRMAK